MQGYSQWVNTYNTGGWVIDSAKTQRCHGGSVLLVDETLNAAKCLPEDPAQKRRFWRQR